MKYIIGVLLCIFCFSPNALAGKVKEGDSFPAFNLGHVGKSGKLNSNTLRGKTVLIDFWASWCEPCKVSFPIYDKLYKRMKKAAKKSKKKGKAITPFVIVAINVDDQKSSAKDFLKKHKVSFPVVFDKGKKLVEQVGVATMPTAFLLDKTGKVTKVHKGFREGEEVELRQKIRALSRK